MKTILTIALLISTITFAEDVRKFTDVQGRSINAKITEYNPSTGKILIERVGGKAAWVKPNIFSQEDQLHIQKWIKYSNFLSASLFNISLDDQTSEWENTTYNRQKKETLFTFVLNNKNHVSLKNIRLEYCLFQDNGDLDGKKDVISKIYKLKAGDVAPNSEKRIRARIIHLSFKDNDSIHEVVGLSLRIYMEDSEGETLVREVRYPESLSKKKYIWGIAQH